MAWTYEQDFEALSTGDLNGQDSWSGDTDFDVVDTGTPYEGSQYLQIDPAGDAFEAISRSVTSVAAGVVYCSLKINRTGGTAGKALRGDVLLYEGATIIARIFAQIGGAADKIELLASSGWVVLATGISNDTWYRIGIEWDASTDKYRANVNGGTWSSWYDPTGSPSFSGVDKITLDASSQDAGATGTMSFDYISPDYSPANSCDYLIVAGGASGGATNVGGGGGAGGLVTDTGEVLTAGTYPIVVGAGGAGVPYGAGISPGNDGGNSSFNSHTATGGGGGGTQANAVGRDGGCGGGGGNSDTSAGGTGSQGYDGGPGGVSGGDYPAGGGGGMGAIGGTGSGSNAGAGGAGTSNSITGAAVTYAGGGGGGCWSGGNIGSGGTGGGGNGGKPGGPIPTAGTDGLGGGGGGGGGDATQQTSGAGGDGVVIVRLLTADWTTITGGSQDVDGSYTVVTFTANGNLVLTGLTDIKSINGLAYASIKSVNGLAVASVKSFNNLE